MTKNLRILHYLSPVRWEANLFRSDIDSNFKVVLKTIEFLPECHHYILMPLRHNFVTNQKNITLIPYNYPWSGVSSKTYFNNHELKIDVTQTDIDVVFNHQLELAPAIANFFSSKRNFSNLNIFSFCHWLDVGLNRVGSDVFNPIYFMNQLAGIYSSNKVFFHSDKVFTKYFLPELNRRNLCFKNEKEITDKITFMPLSSTIEKVEAEKFDLKTNKKIIVFNHRYSESSNVKMLNEFYEKLDKDKYELWVTDCEAPKPFTREKLSINKYRYLLDNCYCSICFINNYTTWNLALQDSLRVGRPTLILNHEIFESLVPKNYKYFFSNIDELFEKLESVELYTEELENFDESFKKNVYNSLNEIKVASTKQNEKIEEYKKLIENKIRSKFEINNTLNPNLARSNGFASIRSVLLNCGYKDDFNNSKTSYYKPDEEIQNSEKSEFFKKEKSIFDID